jgi:hypothetical protein
MAEVLHAIRQPTLTLASAEVAHRSCALALLGEIAFRNRGRLESDAKSERFVDCETCSAKSIADPYGLPELQT